MRSEPLVIPSGMLDAGMFPAVDTIASSYPPVGGSWRLDVVLWAIPALSIAPVFLLVSPNTPKDVDKTGGGGRWWPDRKNPAGLGAQLTCEQQQPLFRHQRLSGDDRRTALGKPELPARRSAGSTVRALAMAVLFLDRQSPPDARVAVSGLRPDNARGISGTTIFVTSSLTIVAATAVIGIAGAVSMTAILPRRCSWKFAGDVPRMAAACSRTK